MMKILISFVIALAATMAMSPPQGSQKGYSHSAASIPQNVQHEKQGFGNPDQFSGFNHGIGGSKIVPFDVSDMNQFPDFRHGFVNEFDDHKGFGDNNMHNQGTSDSNVNDFNGQKQNIDGHALNNFDNKRFDNFFSDEQNGLHHIGQYNPIDKTHHGGNFEHSIHDQAQPIHQVGGDFQKSVHEQIQPLPQNVEHPSNGQKQNNVYFQQPTHETNQPLHLNGGHFHQQDHLPIKPFTHDDNSLKHPTNHPIQPIYQKVPQSSQHQAQLFSKNGFNFKQQPENGPGGNVKNQAQPSQGSEQPAGSVQQTDDTTQQQAQGTATPNNINAGDTADTGSIQVPHKDLRNGNNFQHQKHDIHQLNIVDPDFNSHKIIAQPIPHTLQVNKDDHLSSGFGEHNGADDQHHAHFQPHPFITFHGGNNKIHFGGNSQYTTPQIGDTSTDSSSSTQETGATASPSQFTNDPMGGTGMTIPSGTTANNGGDATGTVTEVTGVTGITGSTNKPVTIPILPHRHGVLNLGASSHAIHPQHSIEDHVYASNANQLLPENSNKYGEDTPVPIEHETYNDDSEIKLPSVKDIHQGIPTAPVFQPNIIHPDHAFDSQVTVSNIDFIPHSQSIQHMPGSHNFPVFPAKSFGQHAMSSSLNRQPFRSRVCPTPRDPSAGFRMSSDRTGYPTDQIRAELRRRPELAKMFNANKIGELSTIPAVIDGTDTCSSSQNNLARFELYGGQCYTMPGERMNFVTCQTSSCDQCSTSGLGTQGMCVPQYEYMNVWAYCERAPSEIEKIRREIIPIARFCGCKLVQC